jgi:hypothetical protein
MSRCCAVLMDVASIQKYVFSSNELVDNLGGSHIVKSIFSEQAIPVLARTCRIAEAKVKEIIERWKLNPQVVLLDTDNDVPFEIGMAEGGKSLVLFRDALQAEQFIKEFTRELLLEAPGMHLAVAMQKDFEVGEKGFKESLDDLFNLLTDNRNRYFPNTAIPNHGITALHSNGNSSINSMDDKGQYLPHEKVIRERHARDEQSQMLERLNKKHPQYAFTNQINSLGQIRGDSYLAIVHIDANGMGKWFQKSTSLTDYRQRSIDMCRLIEESFWDLIDITVEITQRIKTQGQSSGFSIANNNGKDVLPIRPIIMGGDDITFICHAKLALYLAEKYIRIWTKKANDSTDGLLKYGEPDGGSFSACAGIAIIKTKHPFYRAYQYAEQSCAIAKRAARDKNGSWVDFHIIMGTKSGALEKIREEEGTVSGINLYYRPYCLNPEISNEKSIDILKQGICSFKTDEYWSKSKLNNLHIAFNMGREAVEDYLADMDAKGGILPFRNDWRKGYKDDKTPYYDMLGIMDFYPLWLLEGVK